MKTLSKEHQLQNRISEILEPNLMNRLNSDNGNYTYLGDEINLERLLLAMQISCFSYGWQNGQIYNASNYYEKGIKYILNKSFSDQTPETKNAIYKLFNIE